MSPEGFEPPTFGSGIRRAAVAPWALAVLKSLAVAMSPFRIVLVLFVISSGGLSV